MKQIICKIDKLTGKATIEAVGFGGRGCRAATEDLERALGNVTDRTQKATMWNEAAASCDHSITLKKV